MKFKDKDGNVFEDIVEVRNKHCTGRRCEPLTCDLVYHTRISCIEWVQAHPAEAARLMGYEVVRDESKEDNMDKQKPLKDWTLEEIRVECGKHPVNCIGCVAYLADECFFTEFERVYPDAWYFYEKPRFTDEEVADAKVLARALLATGFKRNWYEDIYAFSDTASDTLLDSRMFPSIRPGQSFTLTEIVGGGTDG